MRLHTGLAALAVVGLNASLAAATTFTDRGAFEASLSTSITDTYEAALGYQPGFSVISDAAMTAVLGETTYNTTGFANNNIRYDIAPGNSVYCAGCNGSFVLGFGSTSLTVNNGVFGVGFDIRQNDISLPYSALVTFGTGATQLFALPVVDFSGASFFGLTDTRGIASISFGPDGGITQSGSFTIDNLTIGGGAVPEPASWAMLIIGFGLVGAAQRRRQAGASLQAG